MQSLKLLCPKRSITAVTFLATALTHISADNAFGSSITKSKRAATYKTSAKGNKKYLSHSLTINVKSSARQLKASQNTAFYQPVPEATLNFPNQKVHTSSSAQKFTIRGQHLTSAVTVSTNAPFSLSKDSVVYQSSITYDTSELAINQTVYVRFKPTATGNYADSVSSKSQGADNKIVALTGTAIQNNNMLYGNKLQANNIITPNGDGRNDTWVIKNIDQYPNNTVKIIDKSGNEIYYKRGYTNDWGGTHNGGPLPQGTYYYIVDFGDNLGLVFNGFITVVRD